MKRILSLLLAITILIASGCAGTSGNNTQSDNAQTNNTQNSDSADTQPPETGDTTDEGNSGSSDTDVPVEDPAAPSDSDYNPTVTGFKLGDTIADFSMKTYDGKTVTLSEVLKEKDAVLINIFATWCGPCKDEFPFMEQVYKQYKDQIEVMAMSGDGSDTDEKIRQVATSLGLTFPMGKDSASIMRGFKFNAFPSTVLIDRFGTIVYIHVGSFPDAESFICLYDYLLSDEYTESVVLDELPPMMSHLDQLSSDALGDALGGEGLVFENTPGQYTWPMALAEIDGRSVLASTNQGMGRTDCSVQTMVEAAAGDVFSFDLKISSEVGFDFFQLTVNGEIVKVFSGELDWTSYAYAFPDDGKYLVELSYAKDKFSEAGSDTLWLDNVRVLTGDDAAAALAANRTYPTAAETSFKLTNKNTTQVVFEDPYSIVYKIFGCPYEAYLINEPAAEFAITIAEGVDADAAICYDNHEITYALSSLVSGDGYTVTYDVDTAKGYTYVVFDPDAMSDGEKYAIVFFADEAALDKFTKTFAAGAWHNADEWEGNQEEQEPQGDVVYTLRCVDETGARVAGVTLQVCNDSTCSVYVSDANGECVLTLPADNYEIHILKTPDGFAFDSEAVVTAPVEGGEVTISLKRA